MVDEHAEWFNKVIEIEAEACAHRHNLDPKRVLAVFRSLHDIGWRGPHFPWRTAFDEAAEIAQAATALAVFEKEDLHPLALKYGLALYLSDIATPLYFKEELADLILRFIGHQKEYEEDLLVKGHPARSFEASKWLDWHLNKLYYTKLPVLSPLLNEFSLLDILPVEDFFGNATTCERDDDGNLAFRYRWSPLAPKPLPETDSEYLFVFEPPDATCEFKDAPHLPGFSPDDLETLEHIRAKFLCCRRNVLGALYQALIANDPKRAWEESSDILAKSFNCNEVTFLLEMDKNYGRFGNPNDRLIAPYLSSYVVHNAGLTDLLEVIGHVEKELTYGTMHNAREQLEKYPAFEQWGQYYWKLKPYFSFIDESFIGEIDRILLEFHKAEKDEELFWSMFRSRFNESLQSTFHQDVTVHISVPK